MWNSRHGALELYLSFPFLFWNSNRIVSLRSATIFWGIVIIFLVYYFAVKLFNKAVGILAVLLLIINSNFINILRWGTVFGFTIPVFSLWSLLLFWKWHKTKKDFYFNLGMFMLGVGSNTRSWFIPWFIIPCSIIGIFYARDYKVKAKTIISGLFYLGIGLMPLIYYNLNSGNYLVRFIGDNLFVTNLGRNNLHFMNNVLTRLSHLKMLIDKDIYTGQRISFFGAFSLSVFVGSISWLLYLIFSGRKTIFSKRRIIFLLFLTTLIFILSAFTLTNFYPGQLYILFPYLQLIIAVAAYEISMTFTHRFKKTLFLLVVSIFLFAEIGKILNSYRFYKNRMEINKGSSNCDIANWISNRTDKRIVWFDRRWPYYLCFLKDINPENVRCIDDTPGGFSKVATEIQKPKCLFIFLNPEFSSDYKLFIFLVKELNKQLVEEKRFVNSDGEINFLVCSLKDK
jgi:4-amino-4-deoxy-L-arabinose transferase-like glycosyltransferase